MVPTSDDCEEYETQLKAAGLQVGQFRRPGAEGTFHHLRHLDRQYRHRSLTRIGSSPHVGEHKAYMEVMHGQSHFVMRSPSQDENELSHFEMEKTQRQISIKIVYILLFL